MARLSWTTRRCDSNRRPDEEGIKTYLYVRVTSWPCIPTADLMKKGLRPQSSRSVRIRIDSNRRPDEEGIKTSRSGSGSVSPKFQPQT